MRGDRVWKRRSDRFAISVTQDTLRNLGKSGFQVPTSVFAHTQFCAPRSLNRGWRAGAQNCGCGYIGRAVTVTSGEQRPQYPRILVGQCDRGHIRSARGADAPRPVTASIALKLALPKRGARAVDQQRAQIAVTALGDPEAVRSCRPRNAGEEPAPDRRSTRVHS